MLDRTNPYPQDRKLGDTEWTNERKLELQRLWNVEGLSAGQIELLGGFECSRSAIQGQVHRLRAAGIAMQVRQCAPAQTFEERRLRKAERDGAARREKTGSTPRPIGRQKRPKAVVIVGGRSQHANAPKIMRDMAALVAPQEFLGVALLDLEPGQCRYPRGELPPDIRFCGQPAEDGGSYCPSCARLAYLPPVSRAPQRVSV